MSIFDEGPPARRTVSLNPLLVGTNASQGSVRVAELYHTIIIPPHYKIHKSSNAPCPAEISGRRERARVVLINVYPELDNMSHAGYWLHGAREKTPITLDRRAGPKNACALCGQHPGTLWEREVPQRRPVSITLKKTDWNGNRQPINSL